MPDRFSNPLTKQIVEFLTAIGIPVSAADLPVPAFLPGIRIEQGTLLIDEARLEWPGDLLHEAGHLAMVPSGRRNSLEAYAGQDGGEEMGAIAWSWAALLHLGLPPEVLFHSGGYRGGSQSFIENFREGRYIGVPFLRWIGLAAEDYPKMAKWLRD